MRVSILSLGLCASVTSANIIFNFVQPTCNHTTLGYTGCLQGQVCTEDDTCKPAPHHDLYPKSFQRESTPQSTKRQTGFSTDGKCGPLNDGLLCDPHSVAYTGTCCSQYGWCGNTGAYCGNGCTSGCDGGVSTGPVPAPPGDGTSPPRPDGRCGAEFGGATCDPNGGFGKCCSQYGYCGNTEDHCSSSNGCQNGCSGSDPTTPDEPADPSPSASATGSLEPVLPMPTQGSGTGGPETTDGNCGANFEGTVCGDWHLGACCSMWGYCGNTTDHCGLGCQSGPCLAGTTTAAPGPSPAPAAPLPGFFDIIGESGVPAMHAGLMPNGKVVFLDKVENYAQIRLPNGRYAYSAEYDPADNTLTPLAYKTNAFCSGGIFLADGRWVSLGGNGPLTDIDPTVGDGFDAVRYLARSTDGSLDGRDWSEPGNKLASARWYASAQIMGDGSIFVISGSLNGMDPTRPENNNPTFEMLNPDGTTQGNNIPMDILVKAQPYYMYPFVHLLRDGSVFIFTSKFSELFAPGTNVTIRKFPDLPGTYRTYPNSGGSVLLPLSSATGYDPEVVVCGGGAYQDISSPTDPSCGRIAPFAPNAQWEMDSMPEGRGMVEGTLLPDGTVAWLNGCGQGSQGFNLAADPTLEALIYDPTKRLGQRWTTGGSSTIPRLYHSVALLMLDGTVMVAGSNPSEQPTFGPSPRDPYYTEFRVERYTPPYLQGDNANKRPSNVVLSSKTLKADGSSFNIQFQSSASVDDIKVSLYYEGYVTHSVHMGHRMVFLDVSGWQPAAGGQTVTAKMPPNRNIAPPGPYVVYVVVNGVPSMGQFVMVS
ncbi:carbohydrate-binding module family 18 [Aulographum hederae CBS 113979]|uniref:Carbohydrate-binding module family 18 n=1 Tax=Aulographum hederae CBS 113979 TaxID=1176131 RepID=A0A6G1GSX9_9PEZI|nr:carbohydrate-binding module family 18 [Aulographum hederae CBS 113979]